MQIDYDIGIIGAGPAGLMAAGRAAQLGAKVVLIEKNDRPGKKLLATGGERCNITCSEKNRLKFVEPFGKQGKFLLSALASFGIADILNFFKEQGVATKVEKGNKVFPVSDKASDVAKALVNYVEKHQVSILTNCSVQAVRVTESGFEISSQSQKIEAKSVIICAGGLSFPSLGSSGDGYNWAEMLGHTITPTEPALVGLVLKEAWIKSVQGLELKDVRLSFYQNNKKQDGCLGDALFTHEGISGPLLINLSKTIGQYLKQGPLTLEIDFHPALNHDVLDKHFLSIIEKAKGKQLKNVLSELIPSRLVPFFTNPSEIDTSKRGDMLSKIERKRLINLMKSFPLQVDKLAGYAKAIITAGGVSLKELDPQTMESKLVPNLYFAGEILDLDGPTGGYNLQVCWSTGYVAGESAAKRITSNQ